MSPFRCSFATMDSKPSSEHKANKRERHDCKNHKHGAVFPQYHYETSLLFDCLIAVRSLMRNATRACLSPATRVVYPARHARRILARAMHNEVAHVWHQHVAATTIQSATVTFFFLGTPR
jgi:hypothetical protein